MLNNGQNGQLVPIGVDLGYGYVKVVGPAGERLFPALATRVGQSLGLSKLFTEDDNSHTDGFRVKLAGSISGEFVVGSLARLEGGAGTGAPFEEDRTGHENTAALLATAAALAGDGEPVVAVTGLPPGYIFRPSGEGRTLKDVLEEYLKGFQADVEFMDGGPQGIRTVRFAKVQVFPQAAGGVFLALQKAGRSLGMVGGQGLVGVVDIGFRTTDYMVIDLATHRTVEELSGTLEIGAYRVAELVSRGFRAKTGGEMSLEEAEGVTLEGIGKAWYRGKPVDLGGALTQAQETVTTAIYDALRTAWKTRMDGYRTVLIMGGGGAMLGPLLVRRTDDFFRLVPEPQMANAKGFQMIAQKLATA